MSTEDYPYAARWDIVHDCADGSVAIRRNAVVIDGGPGWIRIQSQDGNNHTIPLTQLVSMDRQER